MDRKAMPENTAPSWNGYSVGRWDGKALVVKTENFNDRLNPVSRPCRERRTPRSPSA